MRTTQIIESNVKVDEEDEDVDDEDEDDVDDVEEYTNRLLKSEEVEGYRKMWSSIRDAWVFVNEDQSDFSMGKVWVCENTKDGRGWYHDYCSLWDTEQSPFVR